MKFKNIEDYRKNTVNVVVSEEKIRDKALTKFMTERLCCLSVF